MKVSIVIPCYNTEKYIRQCMDSVLMQTHKEIEVICVDDGSQDQTRDIIREYQIKDDRVKLICQENSFAGVARNNGMRQATGDYIVFLDSDDYFEADMVELMVKAAQESGADIVLCDAYYFNNLTGEISEPTWILRKDFIPEGKKVFNYKEIPDRIFSISLSVPWNKLYRMDFVSKEKLYFQDTQRSNDEFFVGLSMIVAEKISFVDNRLVYYRTNNQTSLQGYGSKHAPSLDFFYALKKLKDELIIRGQFDGVSIGFENKCISCCVATLRKQTIAENFSYIYGFLKETGFEELGLNNMNEDDIRNNKEIFISMKKYSVLEFLFYNWKQALVTNIERFKFPFDLIGNRRKVALYAAGEVGRSYYHQLMEATFYQLVGWFDKDYKKYADQGKPVLNPEEIPSCDFDVIVIAIEDASISQTVVEYLVDIGVSREKICLRS
jgi:glycosyltransferase involved in cell wall biosynthesis